MKRRCRLYESTGVPESLYVASSTATISGTVLPSDSLGPVDSCSPTFAFLAHLEVSESSYDATLLADKRYRVESVVC